MAALTREDVANICLDILTEASITSLEQNNRAARLVSRNIDVSREALLTAHAWEFALIREDVTPASTGNDAEEVKYRIAKPEDTLRVLPLMTSGYPHGRPIPYTAYADGLYTGYSDTFPLVHVGNVIDPADMPAIFVRAWAADIARFIAHTLTGKASMVDKAQGIYEESIKEAKRINAIVRGFQMPPESYSEARGDPGHARFGIRR